MMAVCGNGLCELGEACPSTASGPCNSTTHCAQDCPVTPRSCPYVVRCCLLHGTCCAAAEQVCAGHGHCLGVTAGYCECNQGYTGPACSQCANGYVARAGGCTFLPGGSALASCSDGTRNGREEGVDCGGLCLTACPASAGTSARRSTVWSHNLNIVQLPRHNHNNRMPPFGGSSVPSDGVCTITMCGTRL
jgi:hypothetical protein